VLRIVEPATPAQFRDYYDLRWKILRAPWNQPRGSERDALDDGATHLMLLDAGCPGPVAVGRLHFNSIREAQIRYMAVATARQRRGYGSALLAELEHRALRLGAARILLDARESALGFYRRHGYTVTGAGHTLFDRIAHVKMCKVLRTDGIQGR